jgi:hypothetical protein
MTHKKLVNLRARRGANTAVDGASMISFNAFVFNLGIRDVLIREFRHA